MNLPCENIRIMSSGKGFIKLLQLERSKCSSVRKVQNLWLSLHSFFSFWSLTRDLLFHKKKSDDLTLKFVFSYRTTFTSFQLEELKIWVPNLYCKFYIQLAVLYVWFFLLVCLFIFCLFWILTLWKHQDNEFLKKLFRVPPIGMK